MKKTNKAGFVVGQLIAGCARVLGVFGGLFIAQESGLEGIAIHLHLLLAGLLLSEAGKIMIVLGKGIKCEYGGVFLQGLAWWVWSLNFPYLNRQFGVLYAFHALAPGLVVGAFCLIVHALGRTARKLAARWFHGCDGATEMEDVSEDGPPR